MSGHQANYDPILPGDIVLMVQDIAELGLEEAPMDAGPSIEEEGDANEGGRRHG